MNKYLRSGQIEKIKKFKFWIDQHLPLPLQPALNYTLGLFSSEVLANRFNIQKQSDHSMIVQILNKQNNIDVHGQIQQGLTLEVSLEMIRLFLTSHLFGHGFRFLQTETTLQKKQIWNSSLILKMNINLELFEEKLMQFQKNKKTVFEFDIFIHADDLKKTDLIHIHSEIQKTNLLS